MLKQTITFLLTSLLLATFGAHVKAQQRHEFTRGDMPPGVAAQIFQMNDRSLIGHVQPVQIVTPVDTVIEIGDAQGVFFGARAKQMSVAMAMGRVYRFKLSNLPIAGAEGKELYPSIEVLGKLNPPAGLENEFPIQVVLTRSDINLALNGQMVTRIIYLEDPRGPLPHRHQESAQPSFDVTSGQDPLRAAEKLGQPMAILRLGSRVPLANDANDWFNFGISTPAILPDPSQVLAVNEASIEMVPVVNKTKSSNQKKQSAAFEKLANRNGTSIQKTVAAVRAIPASETIDDNNRSSISQVDWQASSERFALSPAPSIREVEVGLGEQGKSSPVAPLRRPSQL